jgi:hypothetical protein
VKFLFCTKAQTHWELVKYDIIIELGDKIAGAGFPVYKEKERDYNVL